MAWQVGDLAVLPNEYEECPACAASFVDVGGFPFLWGQVLVVAVVHPPEPGWDYVGLAFVGEVDIDASWCSCGFRKVDKHEACEPEFVTLLKRTKVRA